MNILDQITQWEKLKRQEYHTGFRLRKLKNLAYKVGMINVLNSRIYVDKQKGGSTLTELFTFHVKAPLVTNKSLMQFNK